MKNNKGFFLAETIVMIALVTTIMAFVYPNVSKLYEDYKNRVMYYDQTEDLHALKAVYEKYKGDGYVIDTMTSSYKAAINNGIADITTEVIEASGLNIYKIYIANYMESLSDSKNYNFNRYLTRLKKTTNDESAYRLIGIFKLDTDGDGNKDLTRYASIKIDNPNSYALAEPTMPSEPEDGVIELINNGRFEAYEGEKKAVEGYEVPDIGKANFFITSPTDSKHNVCSNFYYTQTIDAGKKVKTKVRIANKGKNNFSFRFYAYDVTRYSADWEDLNIEAVVQHYLGNFNLDIKGTYHSFPFNFPDGYKDCEECNKFDNLIVDATIAPSNPNISYRFGYSVCHYTSSPKTYVAIDSFKVID